MTLAVAHGRALNGVDAVAVDVEVHLSNGLPAFTLVGLPDTEVRESRERVRSALLVSGFVFPARRITVNLAPADLPKGSGAFDLPLAMALLVASGQLPPQVLEGREFAGELGLTGELRAVRGVLPMALAAAKGGRVLVVPAANAAEAALAGGADTCLAGSLGELAQALAGGEPLPVPPAAVPAPNEALPDLADVRGQHAARLALEVAAAGGHHLLLCGPPGCGKSMLARRLPGILPALGLDEALEVAAVHSLLSGFDTRFWRRRPFRAPHHSASAAALIGGGSDPLPGEVSLAHHGVLFLDELPEFDRRALEMLREPLETCSVTIARAVRRVSFPAAFQLIGAMNPCPCGYYGHPERDCRCTPEQIARYRGKISGPLLDRVDLVVEMGALDAASLAAAPAEGSAAVASRVAAALAVQLARQGVSNARLDEAQLACHAALAPAGVALLAQAMQKLGLSARGYHRVLRVARTLADLAGATELDETFLMQALQMRRLLA
ncbi:YifB family Mg chelatase-like AAA ATPase [Crenobacter caeni]|uniref:YifB family Mg chelatase-like AAA ATPase n=1 Tax=Crenobacter caeni TaxID=2705474 RepID=A0A6B2KT70_9NEIS|nr:YifB family Mg chelatase-like AAA ATPase [Crenobacter caeni]NDV13321.1 YifB family Mg chelatase-like AAA ATPase [Crenobacter caeni]